jgi:tRNA pseudouridine38-40 synthase
LRVKAVIAYDGTAFEGFQKQKRTKNTVAHALEAALKSVGIFSVVIGSGRTDAGVHATGQVVHFNLPEYWQNRPLNLLLLHLNKKLDSIRFKHICVTDDRFHARYDAKIRIYRYLFSSVQPSVFERNHIAYMAASDTMALGKALKLFEGRHNFGYFHKTGSDTTNHIRTIYRAFCRKYDRYGCIYFYADGFLRAQVRMMLHAAFMVANGQLDIRSLREQIEMKKRYTAGIAPPQGLYLARVIY